MANLKFQNALHKVPQSVPPVWFMRQAGRYHQHYQNLKQSHTFEELCKTPELACETAMGPIEEFDFDVAILFSDILFPLEALGQGLKYDPAPNLSFFLNGETFPKFKSGDAVKSFMNFQNLAMQKTRARLPNEKSLIGFVGGPVTLFAYAVEGSHKGSLTGTRAQFALFKPFMEKLLPLLHYNIQIQLEGGAEVVMLFDTVAGEFSPHFYHDEIVPVLEGLVRAFPGRLGYYSKGTTRDHLNHPVFLNEKWAGFGVDHRFEMSDMLKTRKLPGFLQGNFDQALLFLPTPLFKEALEAWLKPLLKLSSEERAGWVCGLGHGVLPKTPEAHVKYFVQRVREAFAK